MISRILMTADAVGGVWTYALDLARSLLRFETRVTLAVMGPAPSVSQLDDARGLELHCRDYKLEWMERPWREVDGAGSWLLSLERALAPDIVHLNGYALASARFRAPKIVVAHSCVLSWWQAVHGEPAPADWNEYRARVAAGVEAADLVIAPSHAMLGSVEKYYSPRASCVIANGRDPSAFRSAPKEPFIFTAGRLWDQAKNLQTLDRAAKALDWPVFAAGQGGDAANIKPLGALSSEAMRDWLARASIYALPARYEPFGLSILEAALSGCALVLGDIPSLRENWDGAAVFVPPNDARALNSALRTLIERDDLRRGLQACATRRASRFTLDRTVRAYLDRYAALRCRSHPATAFKS